MTARAMRWVPGAGSLCEYMAHLRYIWRKKIGRTPSVGRLRVRKRGTSASGHAAAH